MDNLNISSIKNNSNYSQFTNIYNNKTNIINKNRNNKYECKENDDKKGQSYNILDYERNNNSKSNIFAKCKNISYHEKNKLEKIKNNYIKKRLRNPSNQVNKKTKTIKKHICNICFRMFKHGFTLNRHLKETHKKKTFTACEYCGKEYPRINDHLLRCKKALQKKIEYLQSNLIISNNKFEFNFHSTIPLDKKKF